MDIFREEFDLVKFFSSPDGRLNRLPFIITSLILFFLLFFFIILSFQIANFANVELSEQEDRTLAKRLIAECKLTANGREFSQNTSVKQIKTYLEAMSRSSPPEQRALIDAQETCVNVELPKSAGDLFAIIMMLITFILWGLAMICPSIRRLHDRGKSGWWYLGFLFAGFIPFVNIIATIWWFVETWCLRGTEGPNEYGRDPLGW